MSNVIDPLELLTNKNDRENSFLFSIGNPFICACVGFGAATFINWGFRKPAFAGIQKHAAMTVIGGALGVYFDRKRNEYMAKRDAVLRHYIELHPDDFPPIERKKFSEILDPWAPIR